MKNLIEFNAMKGAVLILAGIATIYFYNKLSTGNHLDSDMADMPKIHLSKMETALTKHDMRQSFDEINLAIKSMNSIEHYTDSIAKFFIEKSIEELEILKNELIMDSVNLDDLNHAFYETFNSMAYVNLRLSELRLEEGRKVSAHEYLKTSFSYLKWSLKYSNENNLVREQKVIDEMREILSSLKSREGFEGFDYAQIREEMEQLMQ